MYKKNNSLKPEEKAENIGRGKNTPLRWNKERFLG